MGLERLEPTDEQKNYLVAAIERDDRVVVNGLLKRFGQEVWLTHRRVESRKEGDVFHELSGTPLNIAAYLKNDALAASLVQTGAEVRSGYFAFGAVHDDDCDQGTVTVIEHALRNKLPGLTRALMERTQGIDWNHVSAIALKWAGSFSDDSLFDNCRRFADTLEFVGQVGLFAGRVGQSQVRITAQGPKFEVMTDGQLTGHYLTMADSIAAVAEALGMEPMAPIEPVTLVAPPSVVTDAEISLEQSVADDIPD